MEIYYFTETGGSRARLGDFRINQNKGLKSHQGSLFHHLSAMVFLTLSCCMASSEWLRKMVTSTSMITNPSKGEEMFLSPNVCVSWKDSDSCMCPSITVTKRIVLYNYPAHESTLVARIVEPLADSTDMIKECGKSPPKGV